MKCQEFDATFKTKSGWLCLDFANTVDWHASQNPEETLKSYADLVKWVEGTAAITRFEAESLSALADKKPRAAQEVLTKAIALREVIYRILTTHVHGVATDPGDLAALHKALAPLTLDLQISPADGCFKWVWTADSERLESLLEPVVWSTAQLITSEALQRVGQCADERGCGWLFWDNSRNKSRRWCDMGDCGNRAKARRHYRKSHA